MFALPFVRRVIPFRDRLRWPENNDDAGTGHAVGDSKLIPHHDDTLWLVELAYCRAELLNRGGGVS